VDINVETAWSVYDGGSRDVVVALIDTGVDTSHEDLQNALWVNEGEIAGNGKDDDGNGYIDDVNGWNFYNNSNKLYVSSTDDSHGTHGAGTIAATADNGIGIAGIVQSDHVKLMVLKALGGSDGSGTTESIIQAIQYA
jgi:subtilisin family serine protease